MKHIESENEIQRTVHLVIATAFTAMCAVLMALCVVMHWDLWTLPLFAASVVLVWWLHISQKLTVRGRTMIYSVLTVLAVFYYGTHSSGYIDSALLAVLSLMVFSMTDELGCINLIGVSFLVLFEYHFTELLIHDETLEFSDVIRLVFRTVAVVAAWFIAHRVIAKHKKERQITDQVINELELMNEHTEDFMANVSHELRTPINAVTGITGVLLRTEKDKERAADLLSVHEAGERLMRQIGDILDYTEIDTGRLMISEEEYMITSVINDITAQLRELCAPGSVETVFDVDARIPAKLIGDGRRIKKIMFHLIENAVKFTSEGGVNVKVSAPEKPYGVNLCITVTDTGIGIAEDERRRIMERFYQSDSGRNRRAGGLGLGLAIVGGFVSAMKGFVRIDSEPGHGTTVTVSIPQKIADKRCCMAVRNIDELCVIVYLRPEKHSSPIVRDLYNKMIDNMSKSLHFTVHRANTMQELETLRKRYRATHLFIVREEYEQDPAYFSAAEHELLLCIITDTDIALPHDSRAVIIHKPFYSLPAVNVLNSGKDYSTDEFLLDNRKPYFPNIRALVVDDEEMNLIVAKGIFSEYDMTVTTAMSGASAIELCAKEDFDLVFLDHMMPEMDGIEALKRLRTLCREKDQMPVFIALTANAVSGAREMFINAGFDEFVTKPVEHLELERALRKLLPTAVVYKDEEGNVADDPFSRPKTVSSENAATLTRDIAQNIPQNADQTVSESSYDEFRSRYLTEPLPNSEQSEQAASQTEQSDDDFLSVISRCGIDVHDGLEFCNDSPELYLELLQSFVTSHAAKSAQIQKSFDERDWYDYRIRVHALKSTSRMIGARELFAFAQALENAAKEEDSGYIISFNNDLMESYAALAEALKLAVSTQEYGEETEEATVPVSASELREKLAEVAECLSDFEEDRAENICKELFNYSYEGRPLRDMLSQVYAKTVEFDMEPALECLNALIAGLSDGGEKGDA